MPPRDRNPFETPAFRDSVDGYYRDSDVHVSVLSTLRHDSWFLAKCVFLTIAGSLCGSANSSLLS